MVLLGEPSPTAVELGIREIAGADGQLILWLAPSAPSDLVPLLTRVVGGDPATTKQMLAGRGTVALVPMQNGEQALIRPYRRGGWAACLTSEWYCGWSARSLAELRVLLLLEQQQVPVVRGLGAAAQWYAGIGYRAWLATLYWPGATTLWEWWQSAPRDAEREEVLRAVGQALARLHRAGVVHPDLNATNILVRARDATDRVRLVDFDRARLRSRPADPRASLRRLARSLSKRDPEGRVVPAADWRVLEQAVWRGLAEPACL